MKVSINKKPKSLIAMTVEVPWEEVPAYLKRAAKEISQTHTFPGFRKGQVPYEVVEKKLGMPALLEAASEPLVMYTYLQALREHELESLGAPKVSILARAPGQPFRYEAEVATLPEVIMPEMESLKVSRNPLKVEDSEVEKLIDELRWMHAEERETPEPAAESNKVTITYHLSQGAVPLEGGSEIDTSIVLGKTQVLPEFAEHIKGMKAGEKKQFTIKFPESWARADLAGRMVDVELGVKSVAQIILPELADAFAQAVGKFPTVEEMKAKLRDNLKQEKEAEEERRVSAEAVKVVTEKAKFSDLPELLVESETDQVIKDITARLEASGITFTQYLERLKKTEEVLRKEMMPQAVERVRAMLVLRAVARQQEFQADDKEVLEELEKILSQSQGDPTLQERMRSHEFHEYLKNQIVTRKTVEWIKKKVVQS